MNRMPHIDKPMNIIHRRPQLPVSVRTLRSEVAILLQVHKATLQSIIFLTSPDMKTMKPIHINILFFMLVLLTLGGCSTTSTLSGNTSGDTHGSNDSIAFSHMEAPPVFPGCDPNANATDTRRCFSRHIRHFFSQHFDAASIAETENIDGMIHYATFFIINKHGRIDDIHVSGATPAIEKETVRVLQSAPTIMPGKFNNQPVETRFSMPVALMIVP